MAVSEIELLIRAARAVDAHRTAAEYGQATDEGHTPPGSAAQVEWDASSVLRDVGQRFIDLAEQQAFQARRHERAQQEEARTGVEHRGGEAA